MKELRYRCWDQNRKTWVYWDDLAISPVTPNEEYNDGMVWQSAEPNGQLKQDFKNTDNLVFQLFTGYKDIDNREVYEGDVIKNFGSVVFSCGKFGFLLNKDEKWFDLSDVDWRSLEITGNIFENYE